MTQLKRFLIALFATGLVVLVAAPIAQAQQVALTDEQLAKIQANCVTIKSSLSQLHASDALLRVNRGQMYESMASKLMDNFNNRLSSNRLDARATNTVTNSYRALLDTFRQDYKVYEQKLSEAIRIDCTKEPQRFHNIVTEARTLRATVHSDVQKLHRSIDDYRNAVTDFKLNFERESE